MDRIDGDGHATGLINGIDQNGAEQRVDVDVAVLDSGVDFAHPDLDVRVVADCTGNFIDRDDHGHGTHVAGTVGALDNGTGVVGVAPGARIWSLNVLDSTNSGL